MKKYRSTKFKGKFDTNIYKETRIHPFACEISFNECESGIYIQGGRNKPILFSLLRNFATYARIRIRASHKFTLSLNDQTAVIFFIEHIQSLLAKVSHMQCDRIFYTVQVQFYKLWTF